MKKLIVLFFLVIYSTVGWGISLNYHYCGHHLTKISVLNFTCSHETGCQDKEISMPCCKDRLHTAKSDLHKTNPQFKTPGVFSVDLKPIAFSEFLTNLQLSSQTRNGSTLPPDLGNGTPPLYLFHQVFRL